MKEILIVATEASADKHGAKLITALKKLNNELAISAIGGSAIEQTQTSLIFNIQKLSVMGLIEVILKLPSIFQAYNSATKFIKQNKPECVILIDAPDFNLRLARKIKSISPTTKIIYYISPTIWAWRYKRVNIIRRYIDKMLVILPFEEVLYRKENIPVSYVGHPLAEHLKPYLRKEARKYPEHKKNWQVVIMPGSRDFEIKLLFPDILKACEILKKHFPEISFTVVTASTISQKYFTKLPNYIKITSDEAFKVLKEADAAIIKSGTSTLEAGLLGTPMVIIYKFKYLTYLIGKYLIRIKPQRFGLVNILAGKDIAKEIFQKELSAMNIAEEIIKILSKKEYYNEICEQLFMLQKILDKEGTSTNAAKEVLQYL